MREIYAACKLNSISHFLLRDNGTRSSLMWKIEEEVKIRKVVKTDEHKYFFD
jgi:hypothetical protein